MAGRGTGIPIFFMCPKLRSVYPRDSWDRDRHRVHRTGNTKPRRFNGNQGQRTLDTAHEYVCKCGHRGWTTHVDIVTYPLERQP